MNNNESLYLQEYQQAIKKYEQKKLEYDVAKIFYLNIPYLIFINIIAMALTLVMVGFVLFNVISRYNSINVISLNNPNGDFYFFLFIVNSVFLLLLAFVICSIVVLIFDYIMQNMKIDEKYLNKVISKINKKIYTNLNCDFVILNTKPSNNNTFELHVKEAINHFLNALCDDSSEYKLVTYKKIKELKQKYEKQLDEEKANCDKTKEKLEKLKQQALIKEYIERSY